MVVDAVPASFLNRHVKLAPLSWRPTRTSSRPEVLPNLTGAGTIVVVTPAPVSGAPLRYHVTFGDGFPPVDAHVSRTCSDSRGSRDVALLDTVGTPGITICTLGTFFNNYQNLTGRVW